MYMNLKNRIILLRRIGLLLCLLMLITLITGEVASAETIYFDEHGHRCTISNEIKTPNGTVVETLKFIDDLTNDERTIINNYVEENYPDVLFIREPTTMYNCHSYAWYSTDPSNKHWMNDPSPYIDDGSYELVTSTTDLSTIPNFVSNSTKAVWYCDGGYSHSGIVWTSDMIMSKWGEWGLYVHKQDSTPYDATMIEYFK